MAPRFYFMFRNVFRLLLVLVAFAVLRYLIYAVKKALSSAPQTGEAAKPSNSQQHLHRDPVCGTFVPEQGTLTATSGGVTHHFCSVACRDKFLAA